MSTRCAMKQRRTRTPSNGGRLAGCRTPGRAAGRDACAPALRARLPPALRDAFGASGELEHRQAGAVDFELIGPVASSAGGDCRRRGR